MTKFVAVDRDTLYLFPPSVQEWLPEDHLARFVVETVEQLDLRELERAYAGLGGISSGDAAEQACNVKRLRVLVG